MDSSCREKRYFYEGENFYSSGNKNLDDLSKSNEIIRNLKKGEEFFLSVIKQHF